MTRFVHGTTYYHFAHPPQTWDADFSSMRAMGLNAVRVAEIWPGWEVLEPEPGKYDFGELDAYVRRAAAAGIDVIMGIGVNNPPFWVFDEITDLRTRDVSGEIAVRRVQGANHDHPLYRQLMERFVDRQAKHYAGVPGIIAWQFGNEVRYRADIADNQCTRVRFRHWLRRQYDDDLDRLNREWGVHYCSWEAIYPYLSPEGAPTEGTATCPSSTTITDNPARTATGRSQNRATSWCRTFTRSPALNLKSTIPRCWTAGSAWRGAWTKTSGSARRASGSMARTGATVPRRR
jgi:beta-galactosidase GanA